jgi:hypothetical protein
VSWRTAGSAILEKTTEEESKQTIRRTTQTPRIVNITYYIGIEFLLVEEPILEYDAFFSEDRSIQTLSDEQNKSREDFGSGLEDVELPPDAD